MAVRISSGTRTNSDSLEVHLDQPTIETRGDTVEDHTINDTSEAMECRRCHGWGSISSLLREAGFR